MEHSIEGNFPPSDENVENINGDDRKDNKENNGANNETDKEMIDSIVKEYSSIPPGEYQIMIDIETDIKNNLFEDFGKYISDETKALINRNRKLLVVSEEDFETFAQEWLPKSPEYNADDLESTNTTGSYFSIGDLVVIKDMKAKAEDIWKNSFREFVDKYPQIDEKIAVTMIQYSLIISTLTHEFIHSVQVPEWLKERNITDIADKDIKKFIQFRALAECGACYITNKLLKDRYSKIILGRDGHKTERETFAYLLNKYGENAYYVFFNTKPDNMDDESFNNLKADVLNEFNSELLVDIGIIKKGKESVFDQLPD